LGRIWKSTNPISWLTQGVIRITPSYFLTLDCPTSERNLQPRNITGSWYTATFLLPESTPQLQADSLFQRTCTGGTRSIAVTIRFSIVWKRQGCDRTGSAKRVGIAAVIKEEVEGSRSRGLMSRIRIPRSMRRGIGCRCSIYPRRPGLLAHT